MLPDNPVFGCPPTVGTAARAISPSGQQWYEPGSGVTMLYPIWKVLPRPRFFPDDPWLARLLDRSYDPALGPLNLRMKRRHARDLRKGLFGPEGGRNVPDRETGGVMEFDLPKGWTLRLTYHAKGVFERRVTAGDVDAEFVPPTMPEEPTTPPVRQWGDAEEARPA